MKPSTRSVAPTEPASESAPPAPALAERPRFKVVVRESNAGPPAIGVAFENLQDLNDWQHERFEAEVARLAGVAARLVTQALSGRKGKEVSGDALLGTLKRFVAAIALALDAQPAAGADEAGSQRRSVSDDTFIDQRSGLIAKEVFLRLHREGAFPTKKIGKRVLARWGDVRRAVEGSVKGRKRKAKEASATEDLDDLRREIGLETKGGR